MKCSRNCRWVPLAVFFIVMALQFYFRGRTESVLGDHLASLKGSGLTDTQAIAIQRAVSSVVNPLLNFSLASFVGSFILFTVVCYKSVSSSCICGTGDNKTLGPTGNKIDD